MTIYIVSAPEADYADTVGKVKFHGGKAVIDDEHNPAELAYCRSAGYLVEEDEDAPADTGDTGDEGAKTPDGDGDGDGDKPFDPSEHNADDVLAYLNDADEAEATRVLDAEAKGKDRRGIASQREQILASKQKEGEDQ